MPRSGSRPVLATASDGVETATTRALCDPSCPLHAVTKVTVATDGAPPVTAYADALGRTVRSETPGFDGTSIYTDTGYDALGRVAQVSEPYFAGSTPDWTLLTYDVLGRPLTNTAPDLSVTSTAYGPRTVVVTNDLGQTHTSILNLRGELVQTTDALGKSVAYAYDPFGNPVSITDSAGNQISAQFDVRGRRTQLDDPDLGVRTYAYNAIGERVSRTDAKSQTTTFTYDKLGRTLTRTEAEGVTTFTYDTSVIGRLGTIQSPELDFQKVYFYDEFGRSSSTFTLIGAELFSVRRFYDANGRLEDLFYPTGGVVVRNVYNAQGYLSEVQHAGSGYPGMGYAYWRADAEDAYGNVTAETFGNGIVTERDFDPQTGRLSAVRTGTTGDWSVQDLAYYWDTVGNLEKREDLRLGNFEAFIYDDLNRLVFRWGFNTTLARLYEYDDIGNITSKSDAGAYLYGEGGAGPHAVTTAGSVTFQYDANGNQISSDHPTDPRFRRTVTYSSYDKPVQVVEASAGAELRFSYGPDRELIRQVEVGPDASTRTYVGGLLEKVVKGSGESELRHYVRAAGRLVAVLTARDGTWEVEFAHADHLGSADARTDAAGNVTRRFSFEPFGRRRNENWSEATPFQFAGDGGQGGSLTHGYTGHKQLDRFMLTHMDGRVYDPWTGRFLSPDPLIQDPGDQQYLNRYSYVRNNPLNRTDPSGFCAELGIAGCEFGSLGSVLGGGAGASARSASPAFPVRPSSAARSSASRDLARSGGRSPSSGSSSRSATRAAGRSAEHLEPLQSMATLSGRCGGRARRLQLAVLGGGERPRHRGYTLYARGPRVARAYRGRHQRCGPNHLESPFGAEKWERG